MTENGTQSLNNPTMSKMKTFTTVFCLLDQPNTGFIASNRTFCAIGENTGPCSGDSGNFDDYYNKIRKHIIFSLGGGFLMKHEDVWTIRGIISATSFIDAILCDVSKYSVYADVEKFNDWILEKVNQVSCSGEKR